ncbi:MAG: radical SAM protein [Bacteroidales bacterium]|nr:radical SAM protein [Bacteroidales bacterium]
MKENRIILNSNKRVFVLDPSSKCPLRSLDASRIRNYFSVNNFIVTDAIEHADYIVYVTCSVSPKDVENNLKAIKEIKQYNGQLIVMGCMPGANPNELRTLFDGPMVATKNINDIDKYFPDFKIKFNQTPESHTYNIAEEKNSIFNSKFDNYSLSWLLLHYGLSETFFRKRSQLNDFKKFKIINSRYNVNDKCFIITSYGCNNNCSYCNIRKAVGKIRSRTIEDIVAEYNNLLDKGYRNFHFIADDIGSYGVDINSSLTNLLDALSVTDKKHTVKWSLHGINPSWIIKNRNILKPYIKEKKVWNITLAIESGSNRIIKLMNRNYISEELVQTLKIFRKTNSGLRIASLLFFGFPTETEEDFNYTVKLIQNIKFDYVRVTYYYEFDYLPAAKLSPKVSTNDMECRINKTNRILFRQKSDLQFLTGK